MELEGVVFVNITNRRFNAYGLLYVPATSVVGMVALAPVCVPPGSACGVVWPEGMYVPGRERICAAAEVVPAGMDAPAAASIGALAAARSPLAGSVVGAPARL
jgi:hypothetical protein